MQRKEISAGTVKAVEITQEEFRKITVEIIKDILKEDVRHIGDDSLMMLLTVSYAQLAGKIERKLFIEEDSDGDIK